MLQFHQSKPLVRNKKLGTSTCNFSSILDPGSPELVFKDAIKNDTCYQFLSDKERQVCECQNHLII